MTAAFPGFFMSLTTFGQSILFHWELAAAAGITRMRKPGY